MNWYNKIAVLIRRLFRRYRPETSRLAAIDKAEEYAALYAAALHTTRALQSALQKETRAREELHARKLDVIVGIGVERALSQIQDKKSVGKIGDIVQ